MEVYMVRHGKTDWNKIHKLQGRTDISLNEDGINQAKLVKEKLKNIDFTKVLVSPLKRAIETCELITDKDYIVDDRLIERAFGTLEGSPVTLDSIKNHWDYKLNSNEGGMEPLHDLLKRLELFVNDLIKYNNDDKILIVSHACTIKAIRYNLIGYDENTDFLDFYLENGDIVKCIIDDKELKNIEII